jgi:hypothetical protein
LVVVREFGYEVELGKERKKEGRGGKGMNLLVKGPSSVERPSAFPPFLDICSMIFRDRGWKAKAGAKPVRFRRGVASSMKSWITSLMSWASFLKVTVLNLKLASLASSFLAISVLGRQPGGKDLRFSSK